MPVVQHTDYLPPRWARNPHLNTVYAALVRPQPRLRYERERLDTPDGDFLDLDWSRVGSKALVIVLHGLEGSADRPYARGMVRHFNRGGWDGLGLNFRSCSGEMNRQLRSYHMGETADLDLVLRHVRSAGAYERIALVGFSLGGNVTLKYLQEKGSEAPVDAAVVFSVPCDIPSANVEIDRFQNTLYLRRFLNSLNQKMEVKAERFAGAAPAPRPPARSFREFDDRFTAPMHGFRDAMDYWTRCSTAAALPDIRVPTLLVNALDDTFLSPACYPYQAAKNLPFLHLETPSWGGHVGFVCRNRENVYWSEERALRFIRDGV